MPIKIYKPTSPGRRNMSVLTYEELTARKPHKALLRPFIEKSGRNSQGKITVRHRGGGAKRHYRLIDFKRSDKLNIPAVVKTIEYDPNRSTFIALLQYSDGEKRYILCPQELKVGDRIMCSEKIKIKPGNCMQIGNIPAGFNVHNVELISGRGGQMIRTAGSWGKVASLEGPYAQVALPSGAIRFVHKNCYATIGILSNPDHNNVRIGKAGRKRHMGIRPTVVGKAMNACDHPHGGGEGHSPIGHIHPMTPWGQPTLGYKTRKRKYTNRWIDKDRRVK
ncbi:50S ribosomal protein L2 [Candidatus Peregrinibacteria bacterium]|nr:50S ribosomal protein L2 [Candidatus Peregrinibacteria bacterium]